MLQKIKLSMRISHNALDTDIQDNIDTCLLDLQRVGIINVDTTDKLIIKVCELYCKSQYDYNQKGDRYQTAYENLKIALCLSGDYNTESESDDNVQ